MKKLLTLAASVLLTLSFISCGKKIDSSTWLSNFDDAKKAAQAENKKIFLFFSGDDFDTVSAQLKTNVLTTEEFVKEYTEKFVLVNLDFSNSRYTEDQDSITGDIKLSELYNVESFPCFYILSKEGYPITQLAFDANADLDHVHITFTETDESVAKFDELLGKTKSGSNQERLAAINEIFDSTSTDLVYHLTPLNKLYLSLDKKNETGECAKHLFALSYAKAQDFFLSNEIEKACAEFETLAKNKMLKDFERQVAFYTAAFVLIQSQSNDYEKIRDYLQKSYDAAPDTEEAQTIKGSITQVQMMIDGEGDIPEQEMGPAEKPAQN